MLGEAALEFLLHSRHIKMRKQTFCIVLTKVRQQGGGGGSQLTRSREVAAGKDQKGKMPWPRLAGSGGHQVEMQTLFTVTILFFVTMGGLVALSMVQQHLVAILAQLLAAPLAACAWALSSDGTGGAWEGVAAAMEWQEHPAEFHVRECLGVCVGSGPGP
jgi:hypothetical protein